MSYTSSEYTKTTDWLIDWIQALHTSRYKIGHFGDVLQVNLLAWYGKTKPNATKAHIHQSKEMYYNIPLFYGHYTGQPALAGTPS